LFSFGHAAQSQLPCRPGQDRRRERLIWHESGPS
jgi:hypothetical protein